MAEEVVDARAGEILKLRADAKQIKNEIQRLKAELTEEYIDDGRDAITIVTPDKSGCIKLKRALAKPPVTVGVAKSVLADMTDEKTAKRFCKSVEEFRVQRAKEVVNLTSKSVKA